MRDDPIPELRRALAAGILSAVDGLNITVAAGVLEIDPARLSDLRQGRIERFSVEWLIRLLAVVDRRVELTIENVGSPQLSWFRIMRERLQGTLAEPQPRR